MKARRIDPIIRSHEPGEVTLPTGRRARVTYSGLVIGLRYVPTAPARDAGPHATHIQDLMLMHRRPLIFDQMYVTAMCAADRRP